MLFWCVILFSLVAISVAAAADSFLSLSCYDLQHDDIQRKDRAKNIHNTETDKQNIIDCTIFRLDIAYGYWSHVFCLAKWAKIVHTLCINEIYIGKHTMR